jgi:hypothetical protein
MSGGQAPFSMRGLAGGGGPTSLQGLTGGPGSIPAGQMPPEVLTGITQAAQTMAMTLDSFAQITPDKAAALGLIKDLVQQYLADLMVNGSQPTSPTATGPAFPGGGIDRGNAGPGSSPM